MNFHCFGGRTATALTAGTHAAPATAAAGTAAQAAAGGGYREQWAAAIAQTLSECAAALDAFTAGSARLQGDGSAVQLHAGVCFDALGSVVVAAALHA